jgi:hypothetical protein
MAGAVQLFLYPKEMGFLIPSRQMLGIGICF